MNIKIILILFALIPINVWAISAPVITCQSGHLRVDISWNEQRSCVYDIQRAPKGTSNFTTLNKGFYTTPRYSDFIGNNEVAYQYRVRAQLLKTGVKKPVDVSKWSNTVEGQGTYQNKEELITDLQRANFEFIWSFAHPDSGLVREATHHDSDTKHAQWQWTCTTTGATGMAFFNIAVGVERGWISRNQGAERVLKMLRFLNEKTTRYHGVWPHWIDGSTGKTLPFSNYDDGADLVETAFLAQGFIFVREYFKLDNGIEKEIRTLAHQMWSDIEWDFFSKQDEHGPVLLWHWSPKHGFKINLPIRGATECHIVHLLAAVAPKHKVSIEHYQNSWLNPIYHEKRTLEDVSLRLGIGYGGPLFFTHYSYLGLNPKLLSFQGSSYFEHYAKRCNAHFNYETRVRPTKTNHQIWGLTASLDPKGYDVHAPGASDNGTVTPTASLSSWPYIPQLAEDAFMGMYKDRGKDLWSEYGFFDAYNDQEKWVAPGHVSIDVATIAPMIENARTGLCWNIFSASPEAKAMIELDAKAQLK
jgi:hypothetical protein